MSKTPTVTTESARSDPALVAVAVFRPFEPSVTKEKATVSKLQDVDPLEAVSTDLTHGGQFGCPF